MTRVISGFPGVGKTFESADSRTMSDSDSSLFSWIEPGVRHPEFPQNYINHIKSLVGKVDIVFVSSHAVVRQALQDNGIEYELVYPDIQLKAEYMKRYAQRGSSVEFQTMMHRNWYDFIAELNNETYPTKHILDAGQFMADVLDVS